MYTYTFCNSQNFALSRQSLRSVPADSEADIFNKLISIAENQYVAESDGFVMAEQDIWTLVDITRYYDRNIDQLDVSGDDVDLTGVELKHSLLADCR